MCACVYSWHAIIVDGHSVEELCKALSQPRHQPTAIIAKTIKGKGIPGNSVSASVLLLIYIYYILFGCLLAACCYNFWERVIVFHLT